MDKIEIASDAPADAGADQELKTTLSVAAGSLTLEDAHTLLVTFDPLKTFGPSTYGPFHLRPVAADGTPGEWIPLATIVRLPTLTALICPVDPTANCQLSGSGLYLIDSISLDPNFSSSVQVPEGFVETAVAVQHPAPGVQPATLYLKLRDDPAKPEPVTLNVQTDTPTPPPARGRHQSGPPAAPSTAAMAPAAAGTGTTGTGTAAAAPVAAAGAVPKL